MEQLDKIFSKQDVAKLIEFAHGSPPEPDFECEIATYDMDEVEKLSDAQQAIFAMDHGEAPNELVARFGKAKGTFGDYHNFELTISSDGDVAYKSMGGCRFRFAEPLKVMQLVLDRMTPDREADDGLLVRHLVGTLKDIKNHEDGNRLNYQEINTLIEGAIQVVEGINEDREQQED